MALLPLLAEDRSLIVLFKHCEAAEAQSARTPPRPAERTMLLERAEALERAGELYGGLTLIWAVGRVRRPL